jgi:hypothetical protein
MISQFQKSKGIFCASFLAGVVIFCIVGCKSNPELISQGETHAIYNPVFFSTPECIAYDKALVSSVMKNWDNLLNEQKKLAMTPGKVVIKFELHYDGSIKNLKIVKSSMDDFFTQICVTAINEQAPFPKWPDAMYDLVRAYNRYPANYREFTISFIYPNNPTHPNQ